MLQPDGLAHWCWCCHQLERTWNPLTAPSLAAGSIDYSAMAGLRTFRRECALFRGCILGCLLFWVSGLVPWTKNNISRPRSAGQHSRQGACTPPDTTPVYISTRCLLPRSPPARQPYIRVCSRECRRDLSTLGTSLHPHAPPGTLLVVSRRTTPPCSSWRTAEQQT